MRNAYIIREKVGCGFLWFRPCSQERICRVLMFIVRFLASFGMRTTFKTIPIAPGFA